VLPEELTMLYGEASYCEVYTVTDTFRGSRNEIGRAEMSEVRTTRQRVR
jgi:hypothetical protein